MTLISIRLLPLTQDSAGRFTQRRREIRCKKKKRKKKWSRRMKKRSGAGGENASGGKMLGWTRFSSQQL